MTDKPQEPSPAASNVADEIFADADIRRPDEDDRSQPADVPEEDTVGPPGDFIATDFDLFGTPNPKGPGTRNDGAFQLQANVIALELLENLGNLGPGTGIRAAGPPHTSHVLGLVLASGRGAGVKAGQVVVLSPKLVLEHMVHVGGWGRRFSLVPDSQILAIFRDAPKPPEDGAMVEPDGSNVVPGTPDLEPPSGLTPAQRDAERARKNAAAILARKVKSPSTDPDEVEQLGREGFPLTPDSAPGRTNPPR